MKKYWKFNLHLCQEQLRNVRVSQFSSCFSWDDWFSESYTSYVPRKTWRKLWHSYISKLFLTKMQVQFSIFFHRGSLNVIGDKFRFVRSNFYSFKNPTGRRASVREFITRQTCTICDYTVDYMCHTKTSKSSKIEIFFFTAQILQNQRMLCCGECFHD
jgi:hypothetical protein